MRISKIWNLIKNVLLISVDIICLFGNIFGSFIMAPLQALRASYYCFEKMTIDFRCNQLTLMLCFQHFNDVMVADISHWSVFSVVHACYRKLSCTHKKRLSHFKRQGSSPTQQLAAVHFTYLWHLLSDNVKFTDHFLWLAKFNDGRW